ncbi:MAG TPA: hypothetical protein DD670_06725, partial [Planctomycetaceae bacterium]|nr:hypothetical protein [Planctomycetaceae bacterium]
EMEVYDSSVVTPSAYTSYSQSIDGILGVELDPTTELCDKLVAGALALDGTLNVTSLGGAFANGQVFDILDWASLSGSFETVNLPALASGLSWDISDLYTSGELRVVPEPAMMSLLLLGLIGAVGLARRRR